MTWKVFYDDPVGIVGSTKVMRGFLRPQLAGDFVLRYYEVDAWCSHFERMGDGG